MSRFYGTVEGASKTQATRRGHGSLTTHAASWKGAIRVELWLAEDGSECYRVDLVPWKGAGKYCQIAAGVFGEGEFAVNGQRMAVIS